MKNLLEIEELVVETSTDIARLGRDAAAYNPASSNADVVVIKNATILTMDNGEEVIQGGVLVSRGGLIESVGLPGEISIPDDAFTIDAEGGEQL